MFRKHSQVVVAARRKKVGIVRGSYVVPGHFPGEKPRRIYRVRVMGMSTVRELEEEELQPFTGWEQLAGQ